MTSTTNKVYVQPTVGGDTGVWGTELNTDLGQIDQNLGSNLGVTVTSADVTLTTGASGQYQNFSFTLTGALTGNHQLIFPALGGFYEILNNCTGGFTITAIISGGTGVTIAPGTSTLVWSDATNIYYADSYAYNAIGSNGGFVNKFRNPGMDVFSRSTASATVTVSGAYTADGWIVLPTGASVAVAGVAGRKLTLNSLQVTGATSVTDVIIKQRIESSICAPLSGQTVTVQAQVFNNTGGSITPTLTVRHPTANDNYTSTVTDVSAVSLQVCTNSAWTQVSYTFTAATQTFGLEAAFDFGNNFSTNAKSVKITECDIRVTPGVATGINPNPPPPELRPIGVELPFCQRYYWTSLLGSAPGSTGTNAQAMVANGTAGQNGAFLFGINMRAVPTTTFYSPNTGTSGKAFDATGSADITATGQSGITISGISAPFGGGGLTTGHVYQYYITASAEI